MKAYPEQYEAIRQRLIERAQELQTASPGQLNNFEHTAREGIPLVNDLERYPHAFVLGCIMDQQIDSERAWKIPKKLRGRLGGTFEFEDLATLGIEEINRLFHEPNPLHRFPSKMARFLYEAVQHLQHQYDGDASALWDGDVGSAALVRRFLQFEGVGPKIATMATNILVRDFGIELADRHYIDLSIDRHVKRVFQRLGLVPKGASKTEIIYTAREMHTEYPGIFDFPVWEIGREWCKPGIPNCPECSMEDICPSAFRFHHDPSSAEQNGS